MTPTEQDDELTKAIYEVMQVPHLSERHDAIKQLITAYRKRVALEARIETLDYVINLQSKQFNRWTQMDIANFFDGVGKYYRELKSKQEE